MGSYPRTLLPAALALLLSSPAAASDLVWALDPDSGEAAVYGAEDLRLLARAQTGRGAKAVAAKPNGEGGFEKFYILCDEGIRVLDGEYAYRSTIALEAAPIAAAMAADFGRLAAVAGDRAYLIDTVRDRIAAQIESPLELTAVYYNPSGRIAVAAASGGWLGAIDLEAGSWIGWGRLPAEGPAAFAASSSGRRAWASAGRGLFDLARFHRTFFTAEAPEVASRVDAAEPHAKLRAVPDSGGLLMEETGGLNSIVSPLRGRQRLRNAGDARIVMSADGATAFAAASHGAKLAKLDTNSGEILAETDLPSGTAALALSGPPGQEQPILQKISGDQSVAAGADFNLVVSGPTGGLPLSVTINPPLASCAEALLDGLTTINCTAGAVTSTQTVTISVSGTGVGTVEFSVILFAGGLPDGLFKLSGDGQQVVSGNPFELRVERLQDGAPASGQSIAITIVEGAEFANCPAAATTDFSGRATVTCTAGTVTASAAVSVSMTSGGFTIDPFSVTILPAEGESGLFKITPEPVVVTGSQQFSLTVSAVEDGEPEAGLTLNVSSNSAAVTCPSQVQTAANGQASISCTAGTVSATTPVQVTVSGGGHNVSFSVSVLDGAAGDGLSKISGDDQFVPQGQAFALPLVVRAVSNGTPQANLQLQVTVSQPAIVFCSTIEFTDETGIARIGCSAASVSSQTNVTINVTDPATGRTLPSPFTATISPVAGGIATGLALVSGFPLTGTVGQPAAEPLRVRAVSAEGQAVPGAAVYFRSSQDVQFNPPAIATDASGEAEVAITFGCTARNGTVIVSLTPSGSGLSLSFQATTGAPSELVKVQGDNQSGVPGERLTGHALVVRVTDSCANPIQGVTVNWGVDPADAATLEAIVSATDGSGRSSALVRLGSRPGPFQVIAAIPGRTAVFNLSVVNPVQNLIVVSGGGQQIPAGGTAAQPLRVRATNTQGGPVASIPVEFRVVSGAVSVSPPNATTNDSGEAAATVQAGAAMGPAVVEAEAAGQIVTFALTVVGRAPIVAPQGVVNGASFRQGCPLGGACTIFGEGLMEGVDGIEIAPFPFPSEFMGVSVRINGLPAPIFGVANVSGQEQINFQVPFDLNQGTAEIVVTNNASSVTVGGIALFRTQPAVFEVEAEGERVAAALHLDYALVTPGRPARTGDPVQLFLTGLGGKSPAVPTNAPGPVPPAVLTGQVEVLVGGVPAEVLAAVYAPELVSVDQVNFVVPAEAGSGNVELEVLIDGTPSQTALLPVAP